MSGKPLTEGDDLDVLAPAAAVVMAGGERLEILPLTIGVLPALVRTARPLIDKVLAMPDLPGHDDSDDVVALVMDLVESHGEQLFDATALCTGKTSDWVQKLDLAEFAEVATTVFEVNRDFFAQKLVPLLAGRARAKPTTGAGQTAPSS